MNLLVAESMKLWTLPSLRLTVLLTLASTGLLRWAAGEPGALPLTYTQAGFLILGVLAASSEHEAGGQFRSTLLAVPRRAPLLAAKAVTLAAATLPAAAAAALTCGLGVPATAYLVLTTLLAAASTVVIRHAVPAVLPLLLVYFIASPLLRDRLADWLPGDPGDLGPALPAWTLTAAAIAAVTFHRRDA
ncbi:hypothetical protein [Catenuloplanes atrovinosus]|uniref:Uncharacterized protein n=1 Tax=Catenuloplanes atrovinosus TaxID=137266 RepID=A0AAE3YMY4_9ACTN|nr:hypothetical protein [Catenuloplanes atrovinosus]MDR7275462.1 hypothetical protein [Catenuloplanes atrovinosus]